MVGRTLKTQKMMDRAAALKNSNQDLTVAQIAAKVGRSQFTMYAVLRTLVAERKILSAQEKKRQLEEEIIFWRNRGLAQKDIALKINKKPSRVADVHTKLVKRQVLKKQYCHTKDYQKKHK